MKKLAKILIIAVPIICIAIFFLVSKEDNIDDNLQGSSEEISQSNSEDSLDKDDDITTTSQDNDALDDDGDDVQVELDNTKSLEEIELPLPEDDEARKMVERMREETKNAVKVVTPDEDDEKNFDFNYLTNIREIASFYITEEAFKSLANSFNEYATERGYRGNRFKVTNGKKVTTGVEFDVVQEDGNGQFHCEYLSKGSTFNFGIEKN